MKYSRLKKALTDKEQFLLSLQPGQIITFNNGVEEPKQVTVIQNDVVDMQTLDPMYPEGIGGSITIQYPSGETKEWNWAPATKFLSASNSNRCKKSNDSYTEALQEMQELYSLYHTNTTEVFSKLSVLKYDYNTPLKVLPSEYSDLVEQFTDALNLAGRLAASIQLKSVQELYK